MRASIFVAAAIVQLAVAPAVAARAGEGGSPDPENALELSPGFALYSDDSAKPLSFRRHVEEHPVFYFPPIFFVGVRF